MVFASGSIYRSYTLDDVRISDVLELGLNQACADQNTVVPGIQILMAHVMDGIIIHHRVPPLHVLGSVGAAAGFAKRQVTLSRDL